MYDRYFGVNPVYHGWSAELQSEHQKRDDVEVAWSFTLHPAFQFKTWNFAFREKYPWAWGSPANPAESTFYLQDEVEPFAMLRFSAHSSHFGLVLELPLDYSPSAKLANPDFHNLPVRIKAIDLNFPKFSYLYMGNNSMFVSVGRYPLSWGNARYPVHISPTTYLDNFTFAMRFQDVVYTFHAIPSYPLLSLAELNIQRSFSDSHMAGVYFYDPSKYIFAHRLDFYGSFTDGIRYRVGLSELNVVGGKFPDLVDINPVTIFHNTYGEGYSNVTGGLDFTLDLWNFARLYGELVIDDMSTLTEDPDAYKPGAWAFNVGGELRSRDFVGWVEYAHASEWMYVTNYLPYLRINVRQFAIENDPPKRYLFDYPLGFKYGPDASIFSFGLEGALSELKFSFEYSRLTKGLVNDGGVVRWKWFWDAWPRNVVEPGATVPQRAAEAIYNIFSLSLSWRVLTFKMRVADFEKYFLTTSLNLSW